MMPAGRYYVGDLCYVMTDKEWDEFCALTIVDNDCVHGEFTFADGRRFATYGTKWGDGIYRSNINTKHSVDAGLIGCIRIDDINPEKLDEENMEELGAVIHFDYSFSTGSRDGVITFGDVIIHTDSDEEYYDEEEDYEYE
jgi:hypothetical protein